jgi:hypothetical protein
VGGYPQWCFEGKDLWSWGDWYIAKLDDGFHLITSSGEEYYPFETLTDAKAKARVILG